jgi:hypothetical protein
VPALASREGKVVFVYFRHWALPECTRFEEQILKAPAVLTELRDLYCVVLQIDWDRPLAERWGVGDPPSFVVLDPAGNVLATGSGTMSVTSAVDTIQQARARFAGSTRPAQARP